MPHFGVVRRPNGVLEEGLDAFQIAKAIGEAETVGWLDLQDPSAEEVAALESLFGIHTLALEDARNPETRPKIEEYESFLFVVTRAVNHNPGEDALDLVPLFAFLNRSVIVTIHARPMRAVANAIERLRKHPELVREGPDRLLHHLLDQVVDYYFPFVDKLEDRIEALEDEVFSEPGPDLLERIFAARKEVVLLRRSLHPLREVTTTLMSGMPYIDPELRPFFRDVYDHVLRILDELETNRDILTGLLESYLSQVSNRMNAVMKRLTTLATIGLPFTVISGYFGMNFKVMPWLEDTWGVVAATALMAGVSLGVYSFFRWRDWL